ncbi:MAG: peroxiredoxin-like family protein [Ktedonobacteraceae bacterium]
MTTNIPTNTPLQQQIDEFIAEGASRLPTHLLWDLLRPIGQLITSCAAEQSLKEKARAPDFMLLDPRGSAVRLSHLLEQGPVVITFYRGAWCPYCHLALRAYQQALPQLQAGGATLVAISPQTLNRSRALAEKLELTFAVLSDIDNQVARQFGLVFTLDEAVRGAHKQVGADLPTFNGKDSWDLPMAATFLVDQSGIVRLAFVDPDFTRRLDPSVVIAHLKELQGF